MKIRYGLILLMMIFSLYSQNTFKFSYKINCIDDILRTTEDSI